MFSCLVVDLCLYDIITTKGAFFEPEEMIRCQNFNYEELKQYLISILHPEYKKAFVDKNYVLPIQKLNNINTAINLSLTPYNALVLNVIYTYCVKGHVVENQKNKKQQHFPGLKNEMFEAEMFNLKNKIKNLEDDIVLYQNEITTYENKVLQYEFNMGKDKKNVRRVC